MLHRIALLVLLSWGLLALFVPLLPLQPNAMELEFILQPPGGGHWLGYDDLGRPLADRLLAGARTSFWVALWVVLLSSLAAEVRAKAVEAVEALGGAWKDSQCFDMEATHLVVGECESPRASQRTAAG